MIDYITGVSIYIRY